MASCILRMVYQSADSPIQAYNKVTKSYVLTTILYKSPPNTQFTEIHQPATQKSLFKYQHNATVPPPKSCIIARSRQLIKTKSMVCWCTKNLSKKQNANYQKISSDSILPEPALGNRSLVELVHWQLCKHRHNKLALLELHYISQKMCSSKFHTHQ